MPQVIQLYVFNMKYPHLNPLTNCLNYQTKGLATHNEILLSLFDEKCLLKHRWFSSAPIRLCPGPPIKKIGV